MTNRHTEAEQRWQRPEPKPALTATGSACLSAEPGLVMGNGDGYQLAAYQPDRADSCSRLDDRPPDPHHPLPAAIDVPRTKGICDLQAEAVRRANALRAAASRILLGPNPNDLVRLEAAGVAAVIGMYGVGPGRRQLIRGNEPFAWCGIGSGVDNAGTRCYGATVGYPVCLAHRPTPPALQPAPHRLDASAR